MLILTLSLDTDFEYKGAPITDDVIIKIGQSDIKALETLYQETSKSVYGYALSIIRNHDDAQDIMQETYLKVKASAHLYQPMGKPMAWIFTIVKNLCMLKFSNKKRFIDEDINDQIIISNEISDR